MQVSSALESDQYAIVGGGKVRDFKIAESAHAFKILSNALYSDKETAVARETICNAKDAHIAAGYPDRPIEIELNDHQLVVRDFGPGISDDRISETYLTYFGSTKTNDDSQIGGFGLGCKAPFCLSDHFMVTSCYDNVQTVYALTIGNEDADGKPAAIVMGSMPTTMHGLTVTIPIPTGTQNKFRRAIKSVLRDGGINATLNGVAVEVRDYTELRKVGFGLFKPHQESGETQVKILYGSVLYPLERHEETDAILLEFRKMLRDETYELILAAPPSSIAVTPSREKLGYNDKTLTTLRALHKRTVNQIRQYRMKQRKAAFIEVIQGTRRHQFANLMEGTRTVRNSDKWPKESQFIGGEPCARALAWVIMSKDGINNHQNIRYAAKYYRDHAANLKWGIKRDGKRFSRVSSLNRDQYTYVLRKVMRAVLPVVSPKKGEAFPAIVYRRNCASKFFPVNQALTEYGTYSSMPLDCMRLTIAPSRVAGAAEDADGFFLISKDLKPHQVAEIAKRAERQGLKVAIIEPVERKKPERKTLVASDAPSELFSKFEFGRSAPRKRGSMVYEYVAPTPTLAAPDSFIALALTKRRLPVVHPKQPNDHIGPWPRYPDEEKIHACVAQSAVDIFNRQEIDLKNTALPTSIAERDRLVKMGVPRAATLMLEKLKERIDRKKVADCFIAYFAIGNAQGINHRYRRHENSPKLFATQAAQISRRLASAVYLQPYKESVELDGVYKMWQDARTLFDTDISSSIWLDEVETRVFQETKAEFQALPADFEKSVPKEMVEFLKRMRNGELFDQDVAHLTWISKIAQDPRDLEGDDLERLAVLIEQEGKRYLALDTKEKAIKRNSQKENGYE